MFRTLAGYIRWQTLNRCAVSSHNEKIKTQMLAARFLHKGRVALTCKNPTDFRYLLSSSKSSGHAKLYTTAAKQTYNVDSTLQKAAILDNGRLLDVHWTDGVSSQFHSIWLRHNCHCPQCKHYDSNQKNFDVTLIPDTIKIGDINTTASGDIEITWQEDGHRGVVGQDFLRWYRYDDQALEDKYNSTEPLFLKEKPIPEVSYSDVKDSKNGLLNWLKQMSDFGICLLKGVPTTEGYIRQVVSLIGPLQPTIYGDIFDVIYTKNAINLAYDDVRLNFHMDQPPYESPPGLQFLHCLKFDDSVKGGETLFVDMFEVAEQFRQDHPDMFHTFLHTPATFERIHSERDVYQQFQRPHIQVNRYNQDDVEDYYRAYTTFAKMVINSANRKSIRLKPGEMICFNNRRMTHGRNSFKQTGDGVRHLQGAYVNIDDFKSLTQSLALKIGDGQLVRKAGNNSLL